MNRNLRRVAGDGTDLIRSGAVQWTADGFIITVYCLLIKYYAVVKEEHPLRRGGSAPELTDEEVITMEICGAYSKPRRDQDTFDYFHSHTSSPKVLAEEGERALPCVGGDPRVVDFGARVVEEGVVGAGVDVHLRFFAERFQFLL